MKFGSVNDPASVDYTLPPDHHLNAGLQLKAHSDPLLIHAGLAKFSRPEWRGIVFPKAATTNAFLSLYSRVFNSIELNATGYSLKSLQSIPKWRAEVPDNFTFSPKFPRSITHFSQLKGKAIDNAKYFLDAIAGFDQCIGLPFLQLPEQFTPKRLDVLVDFLKQIDLKQPIAVELRHAGWYDDDQTKQSVTELFRSYGISWVLTDTPGRRDAIHQILTSDSVLIRFQGINQPQVDLKRMVAWGHRLIEWHRLGLRHVYWYAHHNPEVLSPAQCKSFTDTVGNHEQITCPTIQLLDHPMSSYGK